jgi:PAS domain S-box-containing protein
MGTSRNGYLIVKMASNFTNSLSAGMGRPRRDSALSVSNHIFQIVHLRISEELPRVRTDREGGVIEINPAFSSLCGYKFEEIRGRKPSSFLQGAESSSEAILVMRNAIRTRKTCCVEMVNYHKDQTTYRVQIHLSPQFNFLGELEGFQAIERKLD